MRLLASLDPGDRRLLAWSVGIALVLAVAVAFLTPNANQNDNPLPSSYLASQHGARAAYDTLLRSGYDLQRWERPLTELVPIAGPDTVVIFAQPFSREPADINAIRQIVDRGARVLATGFWGGYLLPSGMPAPPPEFTFSACQLEPEGLDPLASSGTVWMVPSSTWQVGNPSQRIQFSCAGQPAVVEYDYGKGHIVWWASATPLENASLARAQNLDLLLNSLGPPEGHHFYWDESLHGEVRSTWSYASGPALTLLRIGLLAVGLLIVFSFSRRHGPVRELPPPPRAAPIEFVEALGSLYQSAGATSTAVTVAFERFRRHALRLCGLRPSAVSAAELAAIIRSRFPNMPAGLEADLAACEEAALNDTMDPRAALKLIQTLYQLQAALDAAARPARRSA